MPTEQHRGLFRGYTYYHKPKELVLQYPGKFNQVVGYITDTLYSTI